ncbi:MAG: DUF354 domain-containing protein, partial [Candidatus Methanofastidiosa archaeon]|nr:DUF354 domain-containing protein [Candidatus Methanofastidiosa archaeon]
MKKRILIDIGHPAHVHLFRNFIRIMKLKDYEIIITSKKSKIIDSLLSSSGLKYICLGPKRKSLLGKYLYQFLYIIKMLLIVIAKRPQMGLGISMTIPIIGKITKLSSIGFDDDDMSATPKYAKYINQSDVVLTPGCLKHEDRGKN